MQGRPIAGAAAGFCQPTYPVVERGSLCWIWMGNRDEADLDLIPPYEDFGLGQGGGTTALPTISWSRAGRSC